MKSGISDYSEVLVYGLKEHFDITLLIDDYELENRELYEDFRVKVYGKDPLIFNLFDYRIYNIGNNPHFHSYIYEVALHKPGLVILHDTVLYYLIVGFYRDKGMLYPKVYEMADAQGISLIKYYVKKGQDLLEQKHLAHRLPLNRELLHSGNKIMVHSNYAYKQVADIIGPVDDAKLRKINHVGLIRENETFIPKAELFRRLEIPEDVMTIYSFGSIDRTRLNHIVCETVNAVRRDSEKKVMYLMVGEGDYVDDYLGPFIRKTGRVTLPEFNSLIRHADIVVNLRHPSMGETSGAVIRAMGLAKPCIVSDDAWFSEVPDGVVVKVQNQNITEHLYESLVHLLDSPDLMEEISYKAKEYIKKEHGLNKISREIADFLESDI